MNLTAVHHQVKLGVKVLVAAPALVVRRGVDLLAVLGHPLPGGKDSRAEVAAKDAVGDDVADVEAVEEVNVELLLTVEWLATFGALPIAQFDMTPTPVPTNGAWLFVLADVT